MLWTIVFGPVITSNNGRRPTISIDAHFLQAKDAFLSKLAKGETETPVPAASPEPDEREGETQWERILTNTQR